MEVLLYTRPGCHLCAVAKGELERLRGEFDFTLTEVDITGDPALLQHYSLDIPVVLLNGREAARHRLDTGRFRDQLEQIRRGRAPG